MASAELTDKRGTDGLQEAWRALIESIEEPNSKVISEIATPKSIALTLQVRNLIAMKTLNLRGMIE